MRRIHCRCQRISPFATRRSNLQWQNLWIRPGCYAIPFMTLGSRSAVIGEVIQECCQARLILAHRVYPPTRPMIIEVQGYDPRNASKNSYVFKRYDPAKPPASHFPVKELNLRSDESL